MFKDKAHGSAGKLQSQRGLGKHSLHAFHRGLPSYEQAFVKLKPVILEETKVRASSKSEAKMSTQRHESFSGTNI